MVDQVLGVRFAGGEYVQANRLTGATIGLDVNLAGAVTASAVDEGVYHLATSSWAFCEWSDLGDPANDTHTLFAPGERLVYMPNKYLSVVKLATATDGILRATKVE